MGNCNVKNRYLVSKRTIPLPLMDEYGTQSAKRVLLSVLFLFVVAIGARAQQKGRVQIIKDPAIDMLQQYRMGTNITAAGEHTTPTVIDKKTATRTTAKGFRVQIYSGSSRTEAYAEQARFKRLYKDIDTYVSYHEPNFRVKVGDFRSRREAQSLMQSLKNQFNNVFIFTEDIYVYYQ